MTVKQTRCPFCHSAFYITALQLNAYRGQARCGQCHQIFDATTNMVMPANLVKPVLFEAEAVDPAEVAATAKPVIIPTSSETPNLSIPAPEETLLFSDDTGLLEEDELPMPPPPQKGPLLDDSFNQQFLDDTFEDIDVLKQQELNDVEKLHAGADDSWINDLLEEDNKPIVNIEPELKPIIVTPTAATAHNELSGTVLPRPPADHDEDLLSFLNRTGAVIMPSTTAKPSNTAAPRPANHRILVPTTVKYNPLYFIGWGVMSLLMLFLLIGQYIYFNFEHLAMDPKTSGYIARLCSMTGCQIPYMNEDELHVKRVKLIANNRLGETTFRGELSNSATLSQPFPALRLSLKRNGKTVASQIIQPRQYLPDNLKTLTRLATKTPYPIQFTIKTRRADIKDFSIEPQYH